MDEAQEVIANLLATESNLLKIEVELTGLQVAYTELKNQLLQITSAATSSEASKKEAQQKVRDEQKKITKKLEDQAKAESKVLQLRVSKKEILARIKAEQNEPAYDVLEPRPTSHQIQGSIINQIPVYSGAYGDDCESFIRLIDRTMNQQGWTSKATAQVVRSKLAGEAALFADNQEKELKPGLENWDEPQADGDNFRTMLLNRFTLPTSELAATEALEGLKQGIKESVDVFYERTRYAIDKLLAKIPKQTQEEKANFQAMFKTQTFVFFKAGLKPSYRTKIFSAPQAQIPLNATDLLQAARNAERESLNQAKQINAIQENDSVSDLTKQVTELTEQLKRGGIFRGGRRPFRRGRGGRGRGGQGNRGRGGFQGGNRGNQRQGFGGRRGNDKKRNGQCFKCGSPNHWADRCPKNNDVQDVNGEFYYGHLADDQNEETWDNQSQGPDPNQGQGNEKEDQ